MQKEKKKDYDEKVVINAPFEEAIKILLQPVKKEEVNKVGKTQEEKNNKK